VPERETKTYESHYRLIKGTIHQEDIMTVNIPAPNITAHSFIKQILLDIKRQKSPDIIIAGVFIPHTYH
jgi:hypothetical protein